MEGQTTKQYGAFDVMKLIAALLVVMIHTSPLDSFSKTGDFFVTRIMARIAVPFFFMVSGFFLLAEWKQEKVIQFLKKTLYIYIVAIVLYFPIGWYTGKFEGLSLLEWGRLLVFDGTFYHLWYLPASILGVSLLVVGRKWVSFGGLGVMSFVLYVIGTFGDSYYGISEQIPALNTMYKILFQIATYTRNGVFFAPMFLWLGAYVGKKRTSKIKYMWIGLSVSFLCMTAEAFVLRTYQIPRHDSMYFFLLPTMYFLFIGVQSIPKVPQMQMRTLSLIVYLIHPLSILAIRGIGKVTKTTEYLIGNSLLHYLLVCVISLGVGILWIRVRQREDRKKENETVDFSSR